MPSQNAYHSFILQFLLETIIFLKTWPQFLIKKALI